MIPAPLSAERARGCNLYLPIPYAKHCKITSDKGGFYYQVNYRTYQPGTSVESLAPGAIERTKPVIDRTSQALAWQTESRAAVLLAGTTLAPGAAKTVNFAQGPAAVSSLFLTVKGTHRDQAMRSTVVRMTFDGEETVWCPAGDLFALGPGVREFKTWWVECAADGTMCLRFPMPYQRNASLTVENHGKQSVTIDTSYSSLTSFAWDDRSMYFHAAWRDQYPIHTRPMQDWNYITIEGQGVFVGDSLSVMNPVKEWWGEGDEKIYIDGEASPSHFGTGTEDYYGYAWCMPEVFHTPFNAQSRCDGQEHGNNWGRTTVMRTRMLDAVPFTRSLRFDMEVWHWAECDVEYAATTYFYARPGVATNRKPDPESAARPLVQPPPLPPPYKVKDAIECESLQVVAKSPGVEADAQGGFGPELWSGQQQFWIRAKKIGDFVELKIPAPNIKALKIILHATKSWDYAIVRLSVNGQVPKPDIDLCSGERKVLATGPIDLGVFTPVDGSFVLRVEIVGANAKAEPPKTYAGLDCIVLQPAGDGK
jgi:hypothetical protein